MDREYRHFVTINFPGTPIDDDSIEGFVKTRAIKITVPMREVSAGMRRVIDYKRGEAFRRITPQQGRAERFALNSPPKNKLPKVYGRVKLGFELWVKLSLDAYKQHAKTLSRARQKRMKRMIKGLRDCGRAIVRRFQKPVATPASGGHAQSSSGAKRGATHTSDATSTAPTNTQFRCGRRQCIFHRRQDSGKRYDRLVARLEGLPERAREAARQARVALRLRIEKAKASCERFGDTPLAGRQEDHLAALRELRHELRAVDDFQNYLVTLHFPHDPRDPGDLTVPVLRSRAFACQRIAEHLFAVLFPPALRQCIAWARAVECGDHGLVHLHVLYRGPERDEDAILEAARAVYEGSVSVDLGPVEDANVPRVLRYLTKPDGLKAPDWHRFKRGERCNVPHPELDARFMLATEGLHTFSTRGLFRRGKP